MLNEVQTRALNKAKSRAHMPILKGDGPCSSMWTNNVYWFGIAIILITLWATWIMS